jgi:1-acyl-sn-glycerol-3-phosphate acyltransferase
MRPLVTFFRTVTTWPLMLAITAVFGIAVIVTARRNSRSPMIDRIIRLWGRLGVLLSGLRLTVEGADRLDPSRSYIVVSNHISVMDIFAHIHGIPVPLRFLAKKELFSFPILGAALRATGMVEVDRAAGVRGLLKMNRESRRTVQLGKSLIVYGEGTRSRDGRLRPFKKGAFALAVTTRLPVVPTTIYGTREAMRADSWWIRGGPVTLVIDEPIPTDGLGRQRIERLRDQTWEIIAKRYEELGEGRATHRAQS